MTKTKRVRIAVAVDGVDNWAVVSFLLLASILAAWDF